MTLVQNVAYGTYKSICPSQIHKGDFLEMA